MLHFNSITNPLQVTISTTNMACHHNLIWKTISFLFLMIPSLTQQRSMAEGRAQHLKPVDSSEARSEEDSKMILRAQIGSRPPRCERRCSWCGGHCQPIQVPTNPQPQSAKTNPSTLTASGDYSSNYKPMSWKCKCGDFFFNP